MDVNALTALGARGQAAPRGAAEAAAGALTGFVAQLQSAEQASRAALTGGVDPHDMVTAIAESKLAVEMVVATRDRAVEAYQEVLRMPV
jgi:flagellar hook-basal body complex protein FliE